MPEATPRLAPVPTPLGLRMAACAVATPFMVLTAMQYGWAGLGIAAACAFAYGKVATALCALRGTQRLSVLMDREYVTLSGTDAAAALFANGGDLQFICDDLTQRRGAEKTYIHIAADAHMHAFMHPGLGEITLSRALVDALDDDEIAYVMAHEIEHKFHPRPPDVSDYTYGAMWFTAVAGGVSMVAPVNVLHDMGSLAIVTVGAAALLSLHRATHSISRMMEYHCDENAVRLTGYFDAARRALEKTRTDVIPKPETLAERVDEILYHLSPTHPSIGKRIRHLERVDSAMRREVQQKNAAPSPAPEAP